MLEYLIPFFFYMSLCSILPYFGLSGLSAYLIKIISVGLLLAFFYRKYKLNFRINLKLPLASAIAIFFIWIFLEGRYTAFGDETILPITFLSSISKFFGMVFVAPLIEELFTRSFLIRFLISEKWQKVKIGIFTWPSFIITILFFGFSHNKWLQGLLAGIILNLLLYREKKIESCIIAHSLANMFLFLYVLISGNVLW